MKEDETIDTFTAKLTTLASKAAGLGHTFDDSTLVRKLLNAVPDRIGNLEETSDHHNLEDHPDEEDNDFHYNDDDGYNSPLADSPTETLHTPPTRSPQINSLVTPDNSPPSYHQSDNDSIQVTNSPSHFDHTPIRGYRTLSDIYENTEELLLAEDEPKNYKEASNDQKWIEAMKDELDSINRNNTWKLTSLPPGHKAIGFDNGFKTPERCRWKDNQA
ncbi:ribonuclease H-like domain, reverse transcriptase, RNA-dependent DNA polymerase [Tanacetum coccineum]